MALTNLTVNLDQVITTIDESLKMGQAPITGPDQTLRGFGITFELARGEIIKILGAGPVPPEPVSHFARTRAPVLDRSSLDPGLSYPPEFWRGLGIRRTNIEGYQ